MPDRKFLVTFSPHDRHPDTTNKVMMAVIIAMLPIIANSIWYYGYYAVKGYLLTALFCVGFEYLFDKISGRPIAIKDNSALLTGLLLAMNMPAAAPWWTMLVGSFVAIIVSKQVYGGLGQNPFNPALVARVFLLIAWPVEMTAWVKPSPIIHGFLFDTVSSATPLGLLKSDLIAHGHVVTANLATYTDQLIGNVSGCMGGDGAIFVLIGGLFMMNRKVISWHIPVSFLGTLFVFTGIIWLINPQRTIDPFLHIISGGAMLAAFFMATDYVTSPVIKRAQIVFGIGCGLIAGIIRVYGSYPEGTGFAVLIMNAFVPLLDKYLRPLSFGEVKK